MTESRTPDPTAAPGHRPTHASAGWTPARIRALGAVTNVPTAAAILGLSRSVGYDLAQRGEFPVPPIRAGHRYRIPVAALLTLLHIPVEGPPTDGAGTT